MFALIGIGFVSYPFVSMYIADYTSTKVVINYENQWKNKQQTELQQKKRTIKEINKNIKNIFLDPTIFTNAFEPNKKQNKQIKDNEKTKTAFKDGEMIGYISIINIDALLPICEGTTDATLSHAVGHLKSSSLPFGTKSSHAVLTAHSGIVSDPLFSNLNKLKIGDDFYITVFDKKMKYKVDQIKKVLPINVNKYLQIQRNKDLVTLVTCTPVPTNTHRLLVRGHRVKYDEKDKEFINKKIEKAKQTQNIMVIIPVVFVISLVVATQIMRKKRTKKRNHKL